MSNLPNFLSCTRLALVPILLSLAWTGHGKGFLFCFIASLLTDIADGLLARRLHLTTELGAKLDSWGDFLTYLSLPISGWWLRPEVVREEQFWLAVGIACYIAAIIVGFLKFSRLTNYHTWGAKTAAVLVGAAVLLFFADGPGWVFRIVMPIVVLTNLEEIAITLTLPQPAANVPSLWHAVKIRQQQHLSPRSGGSEPINSINQIN